jgi:radical SAM protein with 4Fe4S-binding SPASM domain
MITHGSEGCGLLTELNERAHAACVPLNVTLELTLRCNLRCVHCYNFDRGAPREPGGPELAFEEVRTLLGELREAGTLFLSLTGGEAMAHPRFWEIADEAASRSFALSLLSNGTLLTAEACRRLASYPNLWQVSLSGYGARAETHDAITRSPGSFERTWEGARRLRDLGVRVEMKGIVLRGNAGEVAAFIDAAEAEGLEVSVDPTISGRYDGTQGSLSERVDAGTLAELYAGPLRSLLGPPRPDPVGEEDFRCNCARGNAAVSSSGDVYPCIAAPLRAGNLREGGFRAVWEGSPVFRRIRSLRLSDLKSCAPCGLKRWCRRSPGPAYLLTGDYAGIDPWTCSEASILRNLTNQTSQNVSLEG